MRVNSSANLRKKSITIIIKYLIPALRYSVNSLARRRKPTISFLFKGAKIKGPVKIGRFCKFLPNSSVKSSHDGALQIGDYFSLGDYSIIENQYGLFGKIGDITINDNVAIGAFSFISCPSRILIDSDTIIGQYFSIHAQNHNFNDPNSLIRLQGTTEVGVHIGKNCWIGAKVTILDGVKIGNRTVVAAGSVVTKSFEGSCILAGVPAKIIRQI